MNDLGSANMANLANRQNVDDFDIRTYWTKQNWVDETTARVQARTIPHTGTVIYVDASKADDTGNGLTPATAKKTITAGYTAAADGGILQLADGEYKMSAEAGGYLLLNTGTKGVLIRGNAANNAAVILNQDTGGATFCIRLRACKEVDFKDLTIKSNIALPLIYKDGNYGTQYGIYQNCVLENTLASGSPTIFKKAEVSVDDVTAKQFDFVNCTIKHNANNVFVLTDGGINNTILLKNCTVTLNNATLNFHSDYKGKAVLYDNTITQAASLLTLIFGSDTAIPTYSTINVDFRSNIVTNAEEVVAHGVLFGRGTKQVYAVNNQIYLPSINNASNIGMPIKSTPDNVGDAYFAGNYVQAPRPLYIKGGSKNSIEYNVFIGNESNWECFGFVNWKNGADEVLSRSNEINDNKFSGNKYGIAVYNTVGESEDSMTTLKTNTINHNYYCLAGKYAADPATTEFTWSVKATFWGASTNENTSRLISTTQIPIPVPS